MPIARRIPSFFQEASMKQHPNLLIFMTDHQRRESMPGYDFCKMPTLEAFAKESVIFDDIVCPAPHCCPSRATFFSGLYPSQHGVWNNVEVGNTLSRGLCQGVRLWSEDLKKAGYQLYFSGKWHVSNEEGPQHRGFDLLYHPKKYTGVRSAAETRMPDLSGWKAYSKPLSSPLNPRRPGEILRDGYPEYFLYGEDERPFRDQDTVDAAVQKLRSGMGEDPWCMYIGTLGPHDPYKLPQKYLDMYDISEVQLPDNFHDDMQDKPALYRRTQRLYNQLSEDEHREALRHYKAFCSYEDDLFGQVLCALKESGQYDDTVILFLSDHGDYAGAHGLWAKGLPCFREAYSIPLMIRLPGGRQNVRCDYPATLADLAPTILALCNVAADRPFAGVSLLPFLTGACPPARRAFRFTQTNGNEQYGIQRSVWSDDWKYVFNGFDFDELYDLKNDPGELHNLAADPAYAPVIRQLSREMWKFVRAHDDTIVNPYIMTALATYGPGILAEESESI